jgi:hypothetical protein
MEGIRGHPGLRTGWLVSTGCSTYGRWTLDCHCLFISLEYHSVQNFVARGLKGSMSGKVAPSGISHAMNVIRMRSQLKWNSCPWSCASLQSSSSWFTRYCTQFICSPSAHFPVRSTMNPVTWVGQILVNYLACDQLTCEVHCAVLDRGYLVTSCSLLDITISLFDSLC